MEMGSFLSYERIRDAVKQYHRALRPFDDAKWQSSRREVVVPGLPLTLASADAALELLDRLEEGVDDPVYHYAARKTLREHVDPVSEAERSLQAALVPVALSLGEYAEVLDLTASWAGDPPPDEPEAAYHRRMLTWRAKAYRNLGRFNDAIRCYRQLLNACQIADLRLERAVHLLRVGKLYKNYAHQISLFRFCVEEALEELKSIKPRNDTERNGVIWHRAVALDLLGQYHALAIRAQGTGTDANKVLKYFTRAEQLQLEIGGARGVARVRAHRYQAQLAIGTNIDYRQLAHLYQRDVMQAPLDNRGYGVRSFHYARFLHQAGEREEALVHVRKAIAVSKRLRDYFTYVRALLLQAELLPASDLRAGERAEAVPGLASQVYDLLSKARSRARDYGLLRQEAGANHRLLAHLIHSRSVSVEPLQISEVVQRTREIAITLLDRARDTHDTLRKARQRSQERPPEFRRLRPASWSDLLNDLLRDLHDLFKRSMDNFHTVASMLDQVGRRSQAQVGMETGVLLARRMVHDLGHRLEAAGKYKADLEEVRALIDHLIADPAMAQRAEIRQLEGHVKRLVGFTDSLQELRDSLWKDLAGIHFKGFWVDVPTMLDRALGAIVDTVINGRRIDKGRVNAVILSDMWVRHTAPLFEPTLENLLRNAAQHANPACATDGNQAWVKVRLVRVKTGDGENDAAELRLSILNLSAPGDEQKLSDAFRRPGKSTTGGSGFGIELAKFTFEGLLKVSPLVTREENYTCLTFRFIPNGVTITDSDPNRQGETREEAT